MTDTMPPPQKNWPPVARLSLSDQNGRTVIISTEGTVPGRTGKNKRQAAVSQLASWELFWGDGSRNGDVGPPPLELEHTYDASQASAVIRLNIVDVNTLTATATMTITGLTGAPDAPQDVTLTVLSDTSIRVNWSDPSALATSFTVERRLAGVGDFEIIASSITSTSYIDTGLTAATAYEYRVQSFNTTGSSPYSNSAAATTDPSVPPATPPTAPSGLGASGAIFGQVTLTWTDNASDETGFSIERALSGGSFSEIATVQADTVTYVDLTVAASTAYQYRVRAFNAAGNSAYSNTASVTTAAPPIPAAPTNLVAVAQTTTSVLLTWTDNANNEANFELERRIGTQAFVRIITLAANLQTYLDPTAQPATIYQYRIRAINAAGASAYSNIATATTPAAPPPDPPVVVLTPNATTIQVGTATILSTIGTHAGSAPLASYHLDWGDGTVQDGSGAPPSSFTRTYALSPPGSPSTYVPSLRVTDTNNLSATAFSPPITVNPPPPEPVPPNPPSNLTASLFAPTTARLGWQDNSTIETGTKIERRVPPAVYAQINQVGPNIVTYDDLNRTPGTTYDYRVRATGAGGDSAFSNVASITIPPSVPTFFISTTGNDTTGTGTQVNPWRTFAKGFQALTPGSRLFARGGNYNETIVNGIPSGTSLSAQVVVQNFSGETVWLRPTSGTTCFTLTQNQRYIVIDGINMDNHLLGGSISLSDKSGGIQNFIWLQNFEIIGSPTVGFHQVLITGFDHRLFNVTIHGGGPGGCGLACSAYGIYLAASRVTIDTCHIYDVNGAGIHIFSSVAPTDNIVRNCRIHDITRSGDLRIWGIIVNGLRNKIYNNLIYRIMLANASGASGCLQVANATDTKLWCNTIADSTIKGVALESGATNTEIRNHVAYGTTGVPYTGGGVNTVQSNNLFGTNPLFVNPAAANYQLQLGSPAIDSGMTIAGMPAVDLLGVFRPQAAAWDCGCYERVF